MTDKEMIFRFFDRITEVQGRLLEGAKDFLLGQLIVEDEEELEEIIAEWKKQKLEELH